MDIYTTRLWTDKYNKRTGGVWCSHVAWQDLIYHNRSKLWAWHWGNSWYTMKNIFLERSGEDSHSTQPTQFPFFSTVRNPQSSTLPGIKNIQVTWCFMSHCLGQNLETQILEEVSRWSSLKDTLIAMDVVGCWVYSSIFLYDNDIVPITICRWEVSVKKWGSLLKQSSGILHNYFYYQIISRSVKYKLSQLKH